MVTYADLDVKPIINAWGTVTVMGGSTMPEPVLAAMMEAARHYVPLLELETAAGKYVARRLGVEAAFICSGAAAGMALAAAACMAGTDPFYRAQLPKTDGLKNEIVVFRTMRSNYDQGFRVAGARLVEIGMPKKTEEWELERAITPQTAAVGYIVEHEHLGALPLQTVIRVAHSKNIPVIVDAAAEIPPLENLTRFTRMGADLTVFSGGKDIRGPQSSGLILGRADLIQACAFHSAPNHSIGRGMKVGKEEIMGLLTALDLYLSQDFEAEMAQWEAQVAFIIDELSKIPGLTPRRVFPGEPGIQPVMIPRAYVDYASAMTTRTPLELRDMLLQGDPRVVVGTSATGIVVNPQMLEKGEEKIVATCIKDLFSKLEVGVFSVG